MGRGDPSGVRRRFRSRWGTSLCDSATNSSPPRGATTYELFIFTLRLLGFAREGAFRRGVARQLGRYALRLAGASDPLV